MKEMTMRDRLADLNRFRMNIKNLVMKSIIFWIKIGNLIHKLKYYLMRNSSMKFRHSYLEERKKTCNAKFLILETHFLQNKRKLRSILNLIMINYKRCSLENLRKEKLKFEENAMKGNKLKKNTKINLMSYKLKWKDY